MATGNNGFLWVVSGQAHPGWSLFCDHRKFFKNFSPRASTGIKWKAGRQVSQRAIMASEAEYFSTARTTVVATAGMTAAPPFQATKLWNEIVYDFCAGIPLKTYRKRFKTYKHCFPASKAVDWLYEYLQKHHGHNVSRQKALKLLRKFVKTGIVEKVNGSDENYELRDNKELYQLKGKV